MSNKFDEMKAALDEAKQTQRVADKMSEDLAEMLVGRLRHVGKNYRYKLETLVQLKRELRDFNISTRRWKT